MRNYRRVFGQYHFKLSGLLVWTKKRSFVSSVFSDCFDVSEKLQNKLLLHNSLLRGNFSRNQICIFLCLLCKLPVPCLISPSFSSSHLSKSCSWMSYRDTKHLLGLVPNYSLENRLRRDTECAALTCS